jgi:hypothetical protein
MNAEFIELKKVLAVAGLPELGPGPRAGVLSEDKLEGLLANIQLPASRRDLVHALVFLWHDQMEAAHGIAQEIENADGSFVHGILHRREPDYGNATYWFRRVGQHECFPEIARRVGALLETKKAPAMQKQLIRNGEWDAYGFIGLCEKAAGNPAADEQVKLLREIQGIETEVLLEHWCEAKH